MPSHTDLLDKIESHAGISNTVSLSPSERKIARGLVLATEAQIAKSDHRMAVELSLRLDRLRVATAPHKLLPPEIVTEIFLQTSKYGIRIPPLESYSNMPPWTLRRVCTSWRRIVLGLPKLWNRCFLDGGIDEKMSPSEARNFFQFFNAEILHCDGPILIKGGDKLSFDFAPAILSEIVMPNIHRHSALSLRNNSAFDLAQFLHIPGSLLVMLEDLEIVSNSISRILSSSKSPPIFDGLTSLRYLSIEISVPRSLWIGGGHLSPNIPWHQLTYIELVSSKNSMLNLADAIRILGQCNALVKLIIGVNVEEGEFHSHWTPNIHLPLLRELQISNSYSTGTLGPSLLNYLHTPAITHIRLDAGYTTGTHLCATLVSLITRSSCKLKTISIYNGRRKLENPALKKLLELCSNLDQLLTREMLYTDDVLISIASGDILPKLEVWDFSMNMESMHLFEDILKARRSKTPALSVLRQAEIHVGPDTDPSEISTWNLRLKGYGAYFKIIDWVDGRERWGWNFT